METECKAVLFRCWRGGPGFGPRQERGDADRLRSLKIETYEQYLRREAPIGRMLAEGRAGSPPFDLIEAYWWRDRRTAEGVLRDGGADLLVNPQPPPSSEGRRMVNLMFGETHVRLGELFDANASTARIFTFLRLGASAGSAPAKSYWLDRHAPLATKLLARPLGATLYAQVDFDPGFRPEAVDSSPDLEPSFDGLVLTSWPGPLSQMHTFLQGDEAARANAVLLEDEANFLEQEGSLNSSVLMEKC